MLAQKTRNIKEKNVLKEKPQGGSEKKDPKVIWILFFWGILFFGFMLMHWLRTYLVISFLGLGGPMPRFILFFVISATSCMKQGVGKIPCACMISRLIVSMSSCESYFFADTRVVLVRLMVSGSCRCFMQNKVLPFAAISMRKLLMATIRRYFRH